MCQIDDVFARNVHFATYSDVKAQSSWVFVNNTVSLNYIINKQRDSSSSSSSSSSNIVVVVVVVVVVV